jgi:integrase
MQSEILDLGKYVTARRRDDGSYRVLFEVPKRLRPAHWPATRPLPISGVRTGNLSDDGEVDRIKVDAAALAKDLEQAKKSPPVQKNSRTFEKLIESWQSTAKFKRCSKVTKTNYNSDAKRIMRWVHDNGDPDPTTLTEDDIERFLAVWDGHTPTQAKLNFTLTMILRQMSKLGWKHDNPAKGIVIKIAESKTRIWELEDVEKVVPACIAAGRQEIGVLIRLQWEIGQRMTDVIQFRHGVEYVDGVFRFWQSKTNSYVTVPISRALQRMIEKVKNPDNDYLIVNKMTGSHYQISALGGIFRRIRACAGYDFHSDLTLRTLRHSCVVQLCRAGCTVPEIAAITGHRLGTVHEILKRYLPRDNVVAWNAQVKRGLIAESDVQSDSSSTTAAGFSVMDEKVSEFRRLNDLDKLFD